MELMDFVIKCKTVSEIIEIIPLGDIHIGARNCAEKPFRKMVRYIQHNPNAYWIGGGDYIEAIKPNDARRWDVATLADWVLEGKPEDISARLGKIVQAEQERFIDIVLPIKDKCIGLIEGNHEFTIRQTNNEGLQSAMCKSLGVKNLTDQALVRLKFEYATPTKNQKTSVVKLYIRHGKLTGRAAGSEPNHLSKILLDWDADIIMRGHSHNFHILPPVPVMFVPDRGDLPKELLQKLRFAGNWGCWKYSNMRGLSTYESRAEYNAKPILTLKVKIRPFWHTSIKGEDVRQPKISMESETAE